LIPPIVYGLAHDNNDRFVDWIVDNQAAWNNKTIGIPSNCRTCLEDVNFSQPFSWKQLQSHYQNYLRKTYKTFNKRNKETSGGGVFDHEKEQGITTVVGIFSLLYKLK
jgi:hypothetical protein